MKCTTALASQLADNRQLLVVFKGENNVFARDVGESFDGLFLCVCVYWFLNFFKRLGLHKYTSKNVELKITVIMDDNLIFPNHHLIHQNLELKITVIRSGLLFKAVQET